MPQGPSPYLPLAEFALKKLHARGVFLYVDGGIHGDGWCVWAPPEVTARLPEFVNNAADELLGEATPQEGRILGPDFQPLRSGVYVEAAQAACMAANAEWAFILLVEGDRGSGWSIFAPPELNPLMVSELLHGFADDLKEEEPVLRGEATLQ